MILKQLEKIIRQCWSRETCFPSLQPKWTPENPAFGQCAVTALIVYDYFGGELLYCKHQHHYWNRLPDGREVDLTYSQFPRGTIICIDGISSKDKMLEGMWAKEAATEERYAILKKRVDEMLSAQ